ncbi:MAG: aminopeptidase PepN [Roseibaca calidilacus]|uniref:Aminopeptidase N n=1 Tax=Roseibaca calidilacus TaxID=1666912 RepID=A0A0P7WLZ2_9RHOB|nr:aminopeptidase N [Roseibaca calidilacus]KPP91854.1 MAG: aminopeptidase PepN [Roseibaca calidilacus]CUX82404.1 aminopeptidase N [Roseibaca calidilacus]
MRDTAQPIYLADYQPPAFLIEQVELTFRLAPKTTRVVSQIRFAPNPAAAPGQDLRLDGEGLTLIAASIDGAHVTATPDATGLSMAAATLPDGPFTWEAEVEIAPEGNTALEGLYMSNGMYCTQCEAEGFRKITFYPDRPDVMAPFRVRIESDLPVLLSNGNPAGRGPGWAEWDDPHPKPSYLFALVAGELTARTVRFTTMEGRDVTLNIWVRPGDEDKTAYALDALKRSMLWDEQVYGRAYDLDIFNIVAVDDFNMGAMENKGLNIFNSRYVLASGVTATDSDFAAIERIIAHEYFHNWTGNRITCRDWFQLSLKEGLTVFRDQQFMGDMRSHAVKRIEDVLTLRARQFREDAGPLAHPVRPESYVEINNFYTATVYEKGAELIRMLRLLVGDAQYRGALDLYFARHDGQACTIEDWIAVFEDAAGRDLSQFKRWYEQAGTPKVTLLEDWQDGKLTLTLRQHTAPTPGQPLKEPLLIPVALGLIAPDGTELLPTQILELDSPEQVFRFSDLPTKPVVSALRGFSAPVQLAHAQSSAERAILLGHDTDPFARFEAGRNLARDILHAMIRDGARPGPEYLEAMRLALTDHALDPAFRALVLRLPGEDELAQSLHAAGHTPDPDAIHTARRLALRRMADALAPDLARVVEDMDTPGPFSPDARDAGRRALRLAAAGVLAHADGGAKARAIFAQADNMTEQFGAWSALLAVGAGAEEGAQFHRQWQGDRLVMDKWFAAQVMHAAPERAAKIAAALTDHAAFDWKNPNRFRAVIGSLGAHPAGFHRKDGAGYRLVADWLIRLDGANPQAAARVSTVFETWRRYDHERQALIRAELTRMQDRPECSRDMGEMVGRMLG